MIGAADVVGLATARRSAWWVATGEWPAAQQGAAEGAGQCCCKGSSSTTSNTERGESGRRSGWRGYVIAGVVIALTLALGQASGRLAHALHDAQVASGTVRQRAVPVSSRVVQRVQSRCQDGLLQRSVNVEPPSRVGCSTTQLPVSVPDSQSAAVHPGLWASLNGTRGEGYLPVSCHVL